MTQLKAPELTPDQPVSTAPRVVPGAPVPVEKSAKKKRKAKPRAEEEAKETKEAKEETTKPSVADGSQAPPTSIEIAPQLEDKKSAVIELINKRIRNFTKKIQRVKEYQAKSDVLNEDQKRALQSLPVLEGILHELDDTKKAIEPIEVQSTKELALQRLEAESIAHAQMQQAVSDAKADAISKFSAVLQLMVCDISGLALEAQEQSALTSFVGHLANGESKESVLNSLIDGTGEWEGYSYSQLLEFSQRSTVEPVAQADDSTTEVIVETIEPPSTVQEDVPVATEPEVVKPTGAVNPTTSGGFHFMLESELEPSQQVVAGALESNDDVVPNGVVQTEETKEVEHQIDEPAPPAENLDWAADEATELPPINTLEAKFGTSGEATPEAQLEVEREPAEKAAPERQAPVSEGDGFISIPPRRGGDRGSRGGDRGRGRGGYRGRGGNERGRGRGSHRGGEHRGGERGHHRGGHRGGRPSGDAPNPVPSH